MREPLLGIHQSFGLDDSRLVEGAFRWVEPGPSQAVISSEEPIVFVKPAIFPVAVAYLVKATWSILQH